MRRIAVFGGVYSNHLALAEAIRDAGERGAEALYCLGDLGAFGPNPDKVFPLLRDHGVRVMRGNYDDSIARGLDDCQCGYTDPRDNYYGRLSYQYTFANTSPVNRAWLDTLPREFRFDLGGLRVLCCHGSPRQMNEFLWESATPTHFLQKLHRDHACDVTLATHTGIHWQRRIGAAAWHVNVGALGRPANDGRTEVWYTLLEAGGPNGRPLSIEFVPVRYAHEALADEMRGERLPEEFIETIRTGWWTTCLEILPGKERARGKF
ncbi:MAG TPA: metallophosphoesterase family protein [Gemmatimonadaceae bacterium]|nr:metallophosphoesterase family protein [Gemmatimonadaceae bacterium]